MKVLVINSGSSSLKYQLYEMTKEMMLIKGRIERIGSETAIITVERDERDEIRLTQEIIHHSDAVRTMLKLLIHKDYGVLEHISEIKAVGHRIVHGGEWFRSATLINSDVEQKIRQLYDLAPLHNPAHMVGIQAVTGHMPDVPQVAVFDTAFHQSISQKAYLYPIPLSLYKKYGIRRYGFHGTSHEYVSRRAAQLLNKPIEHLKIVTCHLGNGASCAAVSGGQSMDTSMGMTPLEGLMMGTRSGDIDSAIIPFILSKEDLTINEVNSMLNKHSGLLGISGISSDVREVQQAATDGDPRAILALEMYEYRIRKYIGAYSAVMNGIDALVFTGGVGENSVSLRRNVCEQLTFLGLMLDTEKNTERTQTERFISTESSPVSILVIPTNEELLIAQKTFSLLEETN
ncbi:acetate/propionate family kinase [Paenibacillus sp. Soil750]|uniref:acetate/propionate family kinase n=1 Tax=Paenibacillus sp. Soil750 TaxID=1736398 RepID=UPI0006F7BF5E|nr:acetate kinase [Paenibacillus sp. Soil750]KRE70469.1 acetate kinase [Paenibacillus sp. Soil750]